MSFRTKSINIKVYKTIIFLSIMENLEEKSNQEIKIISRCSICKSIKQPGSRNILLGVGLYNESDLLSQGFLFSEGILSKRCYSKTFPLEDFPGFNEEQYQDFLNKVVYSID